MDAICCLDGDRCVLAHPNIGTQYVHNITKITMPSFVKMHPNHCVLTEVFCIQTILTSDLNLKGLHESSHWLFMILCMPLAQASETMFIR